jgi:hypothetical protein
MGARHAAAATAAADFDQQQEAANRGATDGGVPPDQGSPSNGVAAAAPTSSPASLATPATAPPVPPAPAKTATSAPAAPKVVKTPDPDVAALRAQLAAMQAERDSAAAAALESTRMRETSEVQSRQQLVAAQERLAAVEREREESAAKLRAAERERAYQIDYTGLETITPEAARELDAKLIQPRLSRIEDDYAARLKALNDAHERERGEWKKGHEQLTQGQKDARFREINGAIYTRHADFETLLKEPQFNAFLDQRIPGTRTTYRDQMTGAYYDGDAAYVAGLVDQYKSGAGAPTLASIADAGGTSVATDPASPDVPEVSMTEYEDMSFKFRSKQIGLNQWRAFKERFEAAEAAGRVN